MLEEKDTRSWLKSVSAFANGIGGTLIYGIEDKTDELVGLNDAKKNADKISRFIRDRMDPVVPSRRRNLVIVDVFQRLNYMERRGSGFKKIIDDYKAQYNYSDELAPVFKSQYDSFFLTLRNLNYSVEAIHDNGLSWAEGAHDTVHDTVHDTSSDVIQKMEDILQFCANAKSRQEIMDYIDIKNRGYVSVKPLALSN